VAETMSSMSAADGKEVPHRYGSMLLREVCLEGLVPLLSFAFVSSRVGLHWAFSFLILIRIELISPSHRDTHRSQRVQNPNALTVLGKNFRQSFVAVRGFIKSGSA